jgi:hypothetical protein
MSVVVLSFARIAAWGCGGDLDGVSATAYAVEAYQAPPQVFRAPEAPELPGLPSLCRPVGSSDGTCDGIDDDCDGQVDEDAAPVAVTCGVGVCAASGTATCVNGELLPVCTPGLPTGTEASCDGLDNDCDGQVDEDVSSDALALTIVSLGDGLPGGGLDLDGDGGTCAPSPCSAGIDNALAMLGSILDPSIQDQINSGWAPLLGVTNFSADGTTSELAWHDGEVGASCAPATQGCPYLAGSSVCSPKAVFTDARVINGVLTAGLIAPPTVVLRHLGAIGPLELHMARLEAKVVVSGGKVTQVDGLLAGAIVQSDLLAALNAAPPGFYDAVGVTPNALLAMLQLLQPADIDVDGDGTPDAYSVGLKITGKPASIAGTIAP